MRKRQMVLCAHYLKTSKFIPVCISIYILSLIQIHSSVIQKYMLTIFFFKSGFFSAIRTFFIKKQYIHNVLIFANEGKE